jgi:hypothetical protein
VQQCAEELEKLQAQKADITDIAVDDSIDSVVAPAFLELFRESTELMGADMPVFDTEQDIAAAIRKNAAALLTEIDRQEEMMITMTNIGTTACGGPLKMRATREGVTTTATICHNPAMPQSEHTEPVVITRQPSS